MTEAKTPRYPTQFWLMLFGVLISSFGVTMIWPFQMIYASEKLQLPMAAVTSLMTINSLVGIVSAVIAGPLLDRFGRKKFMVLGILGTGMAYLGYLSADSYGDFALLMVIIGALGPLSRVGASAMIADMFQGEQRTNAYALFRTANNIGFGSGPILGGMALTVSYRFGMIAAASSLTFYGLIVAFFLRETLPEAVRLKGTSIVENVRGYASALKDGIFTQMLLGMTLMEICARLMWVILAVYVKTEFGISEARYGIIPTTNALMVVFLQLFVTRYTSRYPELKVLSFGAVFYLLCNVIVGVSNGFWGFLLAMVVMTIGELITAPTATVYVANLAPDNLRASYLALYSLTWNVAMAIGPLGAGIVSDAYGPRMPWFAGAGVGLLAILVFLALNRRTARPKPEPALETTTSL